jgi:hypothetical protein
MALRNASLRADASGFGDAVTVSPPETLRTPCPDAVAISLTRIKTRSESSAETTYDDSVWLSASPNIDSSAPNGNAFRY